VRRVLLVNALIFAVLAAAVALAVQGRGVIRLFSYHIARELAEQELEVLLTDDEPAPMPVHLVSPHGRLSVPKVRAFVDFAVPRLRSAFARWTQDTGATRSPEGRVSAG